MQRTEWLTTRVHWGCWQNFTFSSCLDLKAVHMEGKSSGSWGTRRIWKHSAQPELLPHWELWGKHMKTETKANTGAIFQWKHWNEKQKWEPDEDLSTQVSIRLHFLLKVGGLLQSVRESSSGKVERSGLESALNTRQKRHLINWFPA